MCKMDETIAELNDFDVADVDKVLFNIPLLRVHLEKHTAMSLKDVVCRSPDSV